MIEITDETCGFNWFLGQSGVYNETDMSCKCENGFSGRDEWTSSNNCRVNENVSFILQSVNAFVCVIAILVLLYAIHCNLTLLKETNSKTEQISDTNSLQISTSHLSSFQNTLSRPKITTSYHQRVKRKEQKQKRSSFLKNMLYVFIIWVFSALFYFLHALFFLLSQEKVVLGEPKNTLHRITLFCGGSFVLVGACHLLLTWFNSLPSINKYGQLLKYNSILIKFPNFVPYGGRILICFGFFGPMVVYAILPEYFGNMNRSAEYIVWFFFCFCVLVEVFMLVTFHNLIQIYSTALSLIEMNNGDLAQNEQRKDRLKRVLKSIKQMRIIISNITIGGAALLMLWKSLNFTFQYLFAPFFVTSLTAHTVLVAVVNIRSMK